MNKTIVQCACRKAFIVYYEPSRFRGPVKRVTTCPRCRHVVKYTTKK